MHRMRRRVLVVTIVATLVSHTPFFAPREVFACGFQSLITGNINNEAYIRLVAE